MWRPLRVFYKTAPLLPWKEVTKGGSLLKQKFLSSSPASKRLGSAGMEASKIRKSGKWRVGEKKRKALARDADGRKAEEAHRATTLSSFEEVTDQLAVSLPREVRAYERLRRLQSTLAGQEQTSAMPALDAGAKPRTTTGEGAANSVIKGKAMRRILGAQRLVREEMQKRGSFDELVCVRNAAKSLFQEIDVALGKAREREKAETEKRIEEQESTIRWLEMGHSIFAEQKEGLVERHSAEQRELRRQLEEEREKALCLVCLDKARNTLVLPCLHFQYCLDCLLQHRARNGNTCPTCRRLIEGLCMASSLATNNTHLQ